MTLLLLLSFLALLALSMAVNTPVIKGVTTIVWGTVGAVGSPSGCVAESVSITPKHAGPVGEIENGDGATLTDILLSDGFDAKVQALYDTSKTWPGMGVAVTLTLPTMPASGGSTAGGSTAYACYVCGDPDVTLTRKKESMITLNLRYRPGITP